MGGASGSQLAGAESDPTPPWWQSAVVYQIYPRSFADSNGDGVGDLPGIVAHLDYLQRLGVDVLWLCPIYRSPQVDNGYDVSDYQDIDPLFGTLDDFDALVAAAHDRGLRIVLDIVVNHTSSLHPWFLDARSSTGSAQRDWYIWRPPRPGFRGGEPGGEPNDWRSFFAGPAWTWDEATGAYYLHLFSAQQPDLNWDNPLVREAVHAMMRWWLDRGVDGFRLDVINLISKDPADLQRDGSPLPDDGPNLHTYLAELRREVFGSHPQACLTVGEMPGATLEQARLVTAPSRRELDMIFQFEHVSLDHRDSKWDAVPLHLPDLKRSLARWQTGLAEQGWNSLYFENHDQPRSVSRWGSAQPQFQARSAKALATVLHLHRGTPYIFQGQELGLTNTVLATRADLRDIEAIRALDELMASGASEEAALAAIRPMCRDNARTPVQWTAGPSAGFCPPGTTPWIAVNPNHVTINEAAQVDDPGSVHSHYRRLIALRHSSDLVRWGDYQPLCLDHPALFAFTRSLNQETWLVLANWSDHPLDLPTAVLPPAAGSAATVVLATDRPAGPTPPLKTLGPWDAVILALGPP
ncbi:MAG: alpha-glucosidase [Propionibacteriaceae bacterium]|nr:alpha-glucosidase [Propionibacteriaceae bacterium]